MDQTPNTSPLLVEVSRELPSSAERLFGELIKPRFHVAVDGSGLLQEAVDDTLLTAVGQQFIIAMLRHGRSYRMINYVVTFEHHRELAWEPAPGDLDTAGGDPSRIGVPSGYRWGFRLVPITEERTSVTHYFDCGNEANAWILQRDEGLWINGVTTVRDTLATTLERLNGLL